MAIPEVLLGLAARESLMRGFDTLARLLAITLGPAQRTILATSYQRAMPEALGEAATIARRFVAPPDSAENIGAMLLRNLVWRQHERCGDGCASAAVLAQSLLAAADRYQAAGFDLVALRRGIDRAVAVATAALRRAARAVDGEDDIERVALAMCGDPQMSPLLAELFVLLGADASIVVESYTAPYLEREYLEGGRWKARLASPYLAGQSANRMLLGAPRAVLHDCSVALFAGTVQSLEELRLLLEQVAQSDRRRLLLVAQNFGEPALTTLVINHQRGLAQIAAVELREAGERRRRDFEDLAALTGARLLAADRGDRLRDVASESLGRVRRAEATDRDLAIYGTRNSGHVRARVAALRTHLAVAADEAEQSELRARLGRMANGTAILKIGAASTPERELLGARAEQCVRALPLALRDGVVAGGGSAYLFAADALGGLEASGAERLGVEAVRRALEAPLRQIVANAGKRDPAQVLAELRRRGSDWVYDGVADAIVRVDECGMLDAADVLCEALQAAASGAVTALTTEALVLKRAPETSFAP
ncbi:MAG TPA: TCP-1/cpn60 chaperonin family protein [Roseiflexaceae bacterium]